MLRMIPEIRRSYVRKDFESLSLSNTQYLNLGCIDDSMLVVDIVVCVMVLITIQKLLL